MRRLRHIFHRIWEQEKKPPQIRILRTDSLSMVSLGDFIEQL